MDWLEKQPDELNVGSTRGILEKSKSIDELVTAGEIVWKCMSCAFAVDALAAHCNKLFNGCHLELTTRQSVTHASAWLYLSRLWYLPCNKPAQCTLIPFTTRCGSQFHSRSHDLWLRRNNMPPPTKNKLVATSGGKLRKLQTFHNLRLRGLGVSISLIA